MLGRRGGHTSAEMSKCWILQKTTSRTLSPLVGGVRIGVSEILKSNIRVGLVPITRYDNHWITVLALERMQHVIFFYFFFWCSLAPTRYYSLMSIYHTRDRGTDHRASLVSHPTQCVAVLGGLH